MTTETIGWPVKTREIVTGVFDSTRWNSFAFRDDDIVIATWAKTGTTWMQQIVSELVLGPDHAGIGVVASPWVDWRIVPFEPMLEQLQAQTHRRFLKTHLPIDALVFSPRAKYIYVGRDARDVVWSYHNHSVNYADALLEQFNTPPGLPGQPMTRPQSDVRTYYLDWLRTGEFEGSPDFPSFWENVQGWWNVRELPNVLLVHFANLKADLVGEMRRIAQFLGVEVDEASWPVIAEHCSFEHMRAVFSGIEQMQMSFKGGGRTFINQGTNGRWKDVLSAAEAAMCDEVAAARLTPDCAHWLRTGELQAGP
jgi:aryl sulfotransferase